ncbi:MAG: hypothetical protein A2381_16435 [Bdellovibrionales bacterium RIFOXYB1_FULL_37_110]|nr:MAG: hypothetical protein A2381_16435 [Bdellovibrionales bacterium RIFOXYB1_FULL_37_110]
MSRNLLVESLKLVFFVIFALNVFNSAMCIVIENSQILVLQEGMDPNPGAFSLKAPWECESQLPTCLEYKKRFRNEINFLLQHNHSAFSTVFHEIGCKIEAKLDTTFIAFRDGRSTMEETIAKLEDPSLFDGTGYVAGFFASPYKFVSVPSEENVELWVEKVFSGSTAAPPMRGGANNKFISPGKIMVRKPVFENGFNPESLQNYGARLHYLLTLAEEFYHASQHMQGGNISPIVFVKEKLISNYFADFDLNQLPVEHVARSKPTILLEVDVYAKMLEVLGIEFVPKFIRLRYPSRDLVDIDRIVLEL